jgi:hypothetical protein
VRNLTKAAGHARGVPRRVLRALRPLERARAFDARHRTTLQCGAALLLVGICTALLSVATWYQLGNRDVVISDPTRASTTSQRDLEADLRAPAPHASTTRDLRATSQEKEWRQGRPTGSPAPAKISGTKVAVAMVGGLLALGVAVQRRILRWYRSRLAGRQPGSELDPTADGELPDLPGLDELRAARQGAQQDLLKHGSQHEGAAAPVSRHECLPDPTDGASSEVIEHSEDGVGTWGAPAGETAPAVPRGFPTELFDSFTPASVRSPGESYRVVLFDRNVADADLIDYRSPARLQWDGHDVACSTLRVSLEKLTCRFETTNPTAPPSGTRARITLKLNGALALLSARVTWSRLDGDVVDVGLLFDALPDEHRMLLSRALHGAPRGA